ncbi:hypothetical protein LCGC14_0541210 [marine sediment metagenome]|uniref:Glutaredoxin domain-containing protein n=1 Tax=marine sediment metagenome TaxID=412755 RepID=A0A0F9SB64_9ZZZZ
MADQKEIDNCFAIEDNNAALTCLKEIVRTAKGPCRPHLILLTQENCIPCAEEKALHQEAINNGIIKELSINSPEGLAIAAKNQLAHVPALVLLDCKDNLIFPSD